jgi:hypothetical protein
MKAIGIVFVATLVACQATTSGGVSQVQATSATVASFAPFHTFGFRLAEDPPAPYQVSPRSFEVGRQVRELVAAELSRKGYAEAGANADFMIRISTGTAKEDKAHPTTTSGGSENEPQSVVGGEIVVDAFDRSTSQQVWHGIARAEIDPQRINEPALQQAMQQMLAPFPTRSLK